MYKLYKPFLGNTIQYNTYDTIHRYQYFYFSMLGGGGGATLKSLKKSKSISGILGWVLTFLDPKFFLISGVFHLNNTIISMKISHSTMHLPPSSS